jgi:hypothetical protein
MRTADTKRAMHTTTVAMSAGSRQREGMTGIRLSGTGPSEPSWRTSFSQWSPNRLHGDCAASGLRDGPQVQESAWV